MWFGPIQVFQVCAGQLHFVQNPGGVFQQMLAGSRQLRPAAKPIEETAGQFILQRFDGVAHR